MLEQEQEQQEQEQEQEQEQRRDTGQKITKPTQKVGFVYMWISEI